MPRKSHGMTRTADGKHSPTFRSWRSMKTRCLNPNADNYPRYGGRGITICERWLTFVNFLEDMGERPEGTELDRKDSNGNYELGNCQWSTKRHNMNNRRETMKLTLDGVTKPVTEWAEQYGLPADRVRHRIYGGWSVSEALGISVRTDDIKEAA